MVSQGHKYLARIRLAVLTLALTGGLLFSTYYYSAFARLPASKMSSYIPEIFTEILPYAAAAVYTFILWGPKRLVHIYLRSLVILALVAGWIYLVLDDLVHIEGGPGTVFGCGIAYKPCQVLRASEMFGLGAAILMVADVVLTLKLGPVDSTKDKAEKDVEEVEQGKNGTANNQQHPAPILVSEQQYQQFLQFQQQQQQQAQQQQQPQLQQQFIPMQAFSQLQTQSPALNYSTHPQQ
ncbi:hypothetical protein BGZ52_009475 [Haplosporangium bisporale]|nr:hypothetical protein BGZ52_009475 [Haplosporangium bisporale]KAF9211328.1 hypothetical protein BGZ59_008218 [Podila verticillata]KFH73188.1 hypothetical protein MVEG_00409 [Podila verticillata NRRL 6337]